MPKPSVNRVALGVNIDHVATLRQARYRENPCCGEPSPLGAALAAERAGASGITVHLRADRRHIQDADVFGLREKITTKLNLEMGNTPEILEIALRVCPHDVCLVPENRQEVTTEGGLDCAGQIDDLLPTIRTLSREMIRVSLFIDPDARQVEAAAELGVPVVELHTGAFANAVDPTWELRRLVEAAELAHRLGLQVNAGHGINYANVSRILEMPHLVELNIGHTIVSRAITVGMERAVAEMVQALGGF